MSYFADPLKLVPHQRTLLLFCVTLSLACIFFENKYQIVSCYKCYSAKYNCYIGAAIEHGFLLYMPTVHCNEFE